MKPPGEINEIRIKNTFIIFMDLGRGSKVYSGKCPLSSKTWGPHVAGYDVVVLEGL